MYPFLRLAYQMRRHRNDPPLGVTETHVSEHICWPWDLDMWKELNNGRALTLYDLGRLPYAERTGLIDTLKREGWGLTVAGSSIRYRRRVRFMQRFTMRTFCAGWDERFFYLDQSMWREDGDCASQVLIRAAITGPEGIVPPAKAFAAAGFDGTPPELPRWIRAWIEAEGQRPWPPEKRD